MKKENVLIKNLFQSTEIYVIMITQRCKYQSIFSIFRSLTSEQRKVGDDIIIL